MVGVRRVLLALSTLPLLFVHATFSMLAVDLQTQQIAGILATCLARDEIGAPIETIIANASFVALPCKGGLIAQGWWNLTDGIDVSKSVGEPLLESSNPLTITAQAFLQILVNSAENKMAEQFFNAQGDSFSTQSYKVRQYGLAMPFSANAYSGEDLAGIAEFLGYSNAEVSTKSSVIENEVSYSIQGNLIAPQTIEEIEKVFLSNVADPGSCNNLPKRMMNAMTTANAATGGDVRCEGETLAYFRMIGPDGDIQLDIQVHLDSDFAGSDAIQQMQEQFNTWESSNPCSDNVQPYTCPGFTMQPTASPTGSASFWSGSAFALCASLAVLVSYTIYV